LAPEKGEENSQKIHDDTTHLNCEHHGIEFLSPVEEQGNCEKRKGELANLSSLSVMSKDEANLLNFKDLFSSSLFAVELELMIFAGSKCS
jgi:hypothetical protein